MKKELKRSLHRPSVMAEGSHYENTLLLAKQEAYRKWGRKRERISFLCFLLKQMKYGGWKIWGIQGILLGVTGGMVSRFDAYLRTPQNMAKLLLCLSVLVFMTALPFLYRPVRWRMQEVEAATRFSSVKLLTAKLAVIGIGDGLMLGGIFFTALIKTPLRAESAILYLCFPFLLAGGGCLFMLGHFTPGHFLAGSMGLCFAMVFVFSALPGHSGFLCQPSLSAGWTLVCGLLAVFCFRQFVYLVYRSPYTEIQVV